MKFAFGMLLLPALLILSAAPAEAAKKARRVIISPSSAFFLSTKGPDNTTLICLLSRGKVKFGSDAQYLAGVVSYLPYSPSKRDRIIKLAATAECQQRMAAPACSDGRDNDSDGLIDFPSDPGCSAASDTDETNVVAPPAPPAPPTPPTPSVSACSDGIDNDGDGKSDYPADPGCQSAGDNDESNPADVFSQFSVFRKPFAGAPSIAGMFDHRYPQEFVHVDGTVVTHTGEETTVGQDGHQGYDYAVAEGTEVLATYDGVVMFAGAEPSFFCPPLNKMVSGNSVFIKHQVNGEEFRSLYGHLSSVAVTSGQAVTKGMLLGLSGNTGCSTGPHLHFDIQRVTNTNGGTPASTDPSGWSGVTADPWESHPKGTQSFHLWAPGEAPAEYRYFSLAPNPGPTNSAAVAITYVRWAAPNEDSDPNSEYVELTIDPRFYPSPTYNLGGSTLRNNKNESFTFPAGFLLQSGKTVRVYSGQGINSESELYWGRSTGAWSNNGDCVHLIRPTGGVTYAVYYGHSSCIALSVKSAPGVTVGAPEFEEVNVQAE